MHSWAFPEHPCDHNHPRAGRRSNPRTYQDAITAAPNPSYNRPAVIFGRKRLVGPLRIRLVNGISGRPLAHRGITVAYSWRWLEFPYPEHDWGASTETADRLPCELDAEGWIQTLAHEVAPRGWYAGKWTRLPWPRPPEFTAVSITAVTTGGFARVSLTLRDLARFEVYDLVVRVYDGWRTERSWQAKKRDERR